MEELWTEEFARQYDGLVIADRRPVDALLDELVLNHGSRQMRRELRLVQGRSVWSTRRIRLTGSLARVAWTYEGDSIVVLALGILETP